MIPNAQDVILSAQERVGETWSYVDEDTCYPDETQSQMDSIFGMAALMGPEGMPTEVDFENQFVITVLDTLTSMETEMKPVSLRKEGDNLVLTYEISRGGTQSFSTHSHLTLVVDKVHDGNLKFIQKTN